MHVLLLLLTLAAHQPARPVEAVAAFGAGHAALAERDCRKATAHWNEALRLDPTYWEAIVGIAGCDLKVGNWASALERVEPLVTAGHNTPAVRSILTEARRAKELSSAADARARQFTEHDLAYIAGDPDRALLVYRLRRSLGPGQRLDFKPSLRGAAADYMQYSGSRSVLDELYAGPSLDPSGADEQLAFDPRSGNYYAITRDGRHTVLQGFNPYTGSRWSNVSRKDGVQYGVDRLNGRWLWDERAQIYANDRGCICFGEGQKRVCTAACGSGR